MSIPVLVVDDNATNLALAEFVLLQGGYTVQVAVDAPSAIDTIHQHKPALILMDIQLPGIDGLELTRQLKHQPDTADIRILAVSSYAMAGDRDRAIAAGCDDYVTKPIDTRTLLLKVAELLMLDPNAVCRA